MSKNTKKENWKSHPPSPLRDGLIVGFVLFSLSFFTILYFYQQVSKIHDAQLRTDLAHIAQTASILVDPEIHKSFESPEQESGEAYQAIAVKLRQVQKQIPEIKYIYTVRMAEDKVRFVLDAAPSGDSDGDGVEDHSSIMDIYEDPDESLIKTLQTGKPNISDKPYTDKWGTFISASTPLFDRSKQLAGALAVDMKADDYMRQRHIIAWLSHLAMGVVFLISMTIGTIVYLLKRISLKAERDRIQGLQALIESQERFKSLVANVPGAVYRCANDKKRTMEYLSPAIESLTNYSAANFIRNHTRSFASIIHPEDRQLVDQKIQEGVSHHKPYTLEYRLIHSDGQIIWICEQGKASYDEYGRVLWLDGALLDITESKNMERQLFQSQKMETIGTLAGGVAHDLNNQLTPIVGYVNLLLQTTSLSDPNRGPLTQINESALRCANTIKRLMNFSRPSSQEKEWLLPRQILTDAKGMFAKLLPATIDVQIVCGENLWPIEANETEIQAVLLNLAANARDAMPHGGQLTVKAENLNSCGHKNYSKAENPCVLFTVSDTGNGIPPENLQRIFEPFFTTKPKGVGTGLGLAMVFKTIKDHQAVIQVSSQVGAGTVFQIYFPANPKAEVKPHSKSPKGVPDELRAEGETILFADDEAPIRNLGKALLEKLGYRVLTASDGEEAVRIYQNSNQKIKLVMLDMTMPKLTGRQCLRELLKINPEAKVLLASGYTNEGLPQELIADGASGFLSKPYDIVSVGNELKHILKAA